MTNVSKPFERFEQIERAYYAALASDSPSSCRPSTWCRRSSRRVPDATPQEIADALRWSARKDLRAADELAELYRKAKPRWVSRATRGGALAMGEVA
jgi:hypothetical protein